MGIGLIRLLCDSCTRCSRCAPAERTPAVPCYLVSLQGAIPDCLRVYCVCLRVPRASFATSWESGLAD